MKLGLISEMSSRRNITSLHPSDKETTSDSVVDKETSCWILLLQHIGPVMKQIDPLEDFPVIEQPAQSASVNA